MVCTMTELCGKPSPALEYTCTKPAAHGEAVEGRFVSKVAKFHIAKNAEGTLMMWSDTE
jgi:hypothetical protein